MARSSYGPRAVSPWPAAQKPATRTRVVRLGRAANDNVSRPQPLLRALSFAAAGVVAALAFRYFEIF